MAGIARQAVEFRKKAMSLDADRPTFPTSEAQGRVTSTEQPTATRHSEDLTQLAEAQAPALFSQSSLYTSKGLASPLRSFVSLGRTASSFSGTASSMVASGSASGAHASSSEADSGSMSGKLPSFSPVFSSFSRQASIDGWRQTTAMEAAEGTSQTGGSSFGQTSVVSGTSAQTTTLAAADPPCQRPSVAYDMEASYRDWHNGVFSSSW